MTGCLTIAGLGPGSPDQITPAVEQAIAAATDVVGEWDSLPIAKVDLEHHLAACEGEIQTRAPQSARSEEA